MAQDAELFNTSSQPAVRLCVKATAQAHSLAWGKPLISPHSEVHTHSNSRHAFTIATVRKGFSSPAIAWASGRRKRRPRVV
jgi:hypothetical protein